MFPQALLGRHALAEGPFDDLRLGVSIAVVCGVREGGLLEGDGGGSIRLTFILEARMSS